MNQPSDVDQSLTFNGLNGATGRSLLPPLSTSVISAIARGEKLEPQEKASLRARYNHVAGAFFGVADGVDPMNLASAGWGVIFAHDADPSIKNELQPLLDLRKEQAGHYYCEYTGIDAHRPNETAGEFLVRHKVTPGQPANPKRMPYFLLIVGDPERIPFRFQYMLDVVYAVGRIHFDKLEDYGHYARSVVDAEARAKRKLRTAFFGVRNPNDNATALSAEYLVRPLAQEVESAFPSYLTRTVMGDDATKTQLAKIVGGQDTPDLLFTASHGVGFDNGDPRQLTRQGALVCGDWPGSTPVMPEQMFAADDVGDHAQPLGLVAFLFACYGAGTPKNDDFARQALGLPAEIAPAAFISRLPKRLLSHPNGGALAVIGHVERAWSCSFIWPGLKEQVDVYSSVMGKLLKGAPVGLAVEFLNDRYAALTTLLESDKEEIEFGKVPDEWALSFLWTARNDARNTVIIGDPAVRLPAG